MKLHLLKALGPGSHLLGLPYWEHLYGLSDKYLAGGYEDTISLANVNVLSKMKLDQIKVK